MTAVTHAVTEERVATTTEAAGVALAPAPSHPTVATRVAMTVSTAIVGTAPIAMPTLVGKMIGPITQSVRLHHHHSLKMNETAALFLSSSLQPVCVPES
jgi:hypothetical protein